MPEINIKVNSNKTGYIIEMNYNEKTLVEEVEGMMGLTNKLFEMEQNIRKEGVI